MGVIETAKKKKRLKRNKKKRKKENRKNYSARSRYLYNFKRWYYYGMPDGDDDIFIFFLITVNARVALRFGLGSLSEAKGVYEWTRCRTLKNCHARRDSERDLFVLTYLCTYGRR